MKKVTRVEVISEKGRILVRWNLKNVETQIQDEGRTLKIFIEGDKE